MSSDKVTLTEQQSHEGDNAGTLSEADRIVRKLGLQEHEEGGWFRECYFETEVTTAEGRPCGSSILFLLKAGERSHWHRLDATEIWHYHAGAPLLLSVASNEEGPVTEYRLGPDILGGDLPQARVPSRHWQTARSLGAWTLVGCTVTPGFSYKGFELAPKEFDIPRLTPRYMSSSSASTMLTTPIKVGRMELLHRIVLAPLTRSRSKLNTLTQTPIHAEYYRQRASKGGLLISEATFISPETVGFQRSPGIFTAEQVESWKQVTQAVHEKGGYIYCQLWHIGRVAHPSFAAHALVKAQAVPTPPGVSASDVPTGLPAVTYDGQTVDGAVPRALETKEIPRLIDDYRHAARCAIEAGFDGVELHGAHGYLIDQFLNDGVNKRTDQYGGSLENRARLLLEVIDALIAELGADRVACRLSPHNNDTYSYNGVKDSNPDAIYGYAIKELSKRKLAYLLLTEPRWDPKFKGDAVTDPGHQLPSVNADKFRSLYEGVLIGAGGYTPLSGLQALELGKYDLIGFGRWFISNPDIVTRIQYRQPLNIYRRETFYIWKSPEPEGIDEGYTDYPTFDQVLRQIGYSEEEVKDLSSRVLSDEEAEQIVARSHDKGLKYPLITQVRLGNSTSAGSRL